jgi:hypothetical protein
MALIVAALTVVGQSRSGATSLITGVPLMTRLANAAISYGRYLAEIAWPINLACFYPYDRALRSPWQLHLFAC